MNKCPNCGHEWKDSNQVKGGEDRWKGVSKAKRSEIARKAAKARWAKVQKPRSE